MIQGFPYKRARPQRFSYIARYAPKWNKFSLYWELPCAERPKSVAVAFIFLYFPFYFSLSARPQRFWAVRRMATPHKGKIYLTSAHSELCRKTFADALVCMGIPVNASVIKSSFVYCNLFVNSLFTFLCYKNCSTQFFQHECWKSREHVQ